MVCKRILICGVNGQLGSALRKIYSKDEDFEVYGLDRTSKGLLQCDITHPETLKALFEKIKPHIVINSAALVNADLCEKNKEGAYNINYIGNKNLLELSKKFKSFFVFISSYYIFDGAQKYYDEKGIPTPLNYYGITKLMSEIETRFYEKSLIIRPSKIFSVGYDTRNFIAMTLNSLKNNKKVPAITDQYNNPIHVDLLAKSIKGLISMNKKGIYNVGGEDFVNNFELAKRFAQHFNFDDSLIKKIKTKDINQDAPRPKYVNLKLDKIKAEGIQTYNLKTMFDMMQLKN